MVATSKAAEQKGWLVMRIVWVAAGFAAGYVMGSKAGRQRYEQIRQTATNFMHTPVVADAQARVRELTERGAEAVAAKVGLSTSEEPSPVAPVATLANPPYRRPKEKLS
jgi:hypothetical protein